MKLTMNTTRLQDMIAKSVKCASNDNQRPLTSLIAIQLKDNTLTLITSSESNYLYVRQDSIVGDDFYVVVPVEIFSKLVSKITAEMTTLEVVDGNLVVRGGKGEHTIEIALNEEGEPVTYPDPLNTLDSSMYQSMSVKKSTFNLVLGVSSASIAAGETAKDLPEVFRGYYVGDSIVTSDTTKLCGIKIRMFDTPIMIRPETMRLTEVFSSENLKLSVNDLSVVISSEDTVDCVIISKLMENIEEFPVDSLTALIDTDYKSECAVDKMSLLQALDRLTLFIDKLDDFGVYLTFTQEGLKLANKKSSSEELVEYVASDNFTPFTCKLDIKMLTDQVKAAPGELINLHYGNDTCVKFVDGNVSQLIALE